MSAFFSDLDIKEVCMISLPHFRGLNQNKFVTFKTFLDSRLLSAMSHVFSQHSGFFDLMAPLYQPLNVENRA